jgi:Carboxypeptidase regulatory-like domain
MTIRTCPKCSAYYADESLAFCLVDGMPLISVDPGSERWGDGTRIIEEKTNASRRQQRRLKWRRVALSAITTLILLMVVSRSFTVETTPAGHRLALTVVASPSPSPAVLSLISPSESPSPLESESPSESESPRESGPPSDSKSPSPTHSETSSPIETDTSSPTESETSAPALVYRISGRVTDGSQSLGGVKVMLEGSKLTSTTTDANGNYSFNDLQAGGDYTITPRGKMNFAPQSRSFDNLKQDEAGNFLVQIKFYSISGQVIYSGQPLSGVKITLEGLKLTSTTTDANGNYSFNGLQAGGRYIITPRAKVNLTPLSRSFNNLAQDESANFSGVGKDESPPPPPQECSDDDKSNEGKMIYDRLSAGWRKKIEDERARIVVENVRPGVEGEASLSRIEYQSTFPRGCKMAFVTLTYAWLIKTGSPVAPAKTVRVPKQKPFACYKVFGLWRCSY